MGSIVGFQSRTVSISPMTEKSTLFSLAMMIGCDILIFRRRRKIRKTEEVKRW